MPEPEPAEPQGEAIALDVLYEDDELIVINKPAGLVVHPGAGNWTGTLVNALIHHCGDSLSGIGGVRRPGIVHRLDKETSGCLVIAKNDLAHQSLAAQFAGRTVEKTYLAIVEGSPRRRSGEVNEPIGRHAVNRQKMKVTTAEKGREALTLYRVLSSADGLSLVECRPRTGRTHQIRVHLKHLGHPIAGDPVYGKRGKYARHLLHAWRLAFDHPRTGERLTFKLWTVRIGRTSCELRIEASHQGDTRFKLKQVLVFITAEQGRATPIPLELQTRMQRFAEDDVPAGPPAAPKPASAKKPRRKR